MAGPYSFNRFNHQSLTCGHCGHLVDAEVFTLMEGGGMASGGIAVAICPQCRRATNLVPSRDSFDPIQIPGPKPGGSVDHLPDGVGRLYDEIRTCISHGAHTAAVIVGRTLLMHVAVDHGGKERDTFELQMDAIESAGLVPANSRRTWVAAIKKIGGDATHKTPPTTRADALKLLDFVQLLLRCAYEAPKRAEMP